MINLGELNDIVPDRQFYEQLIAKAIFFRSAEKIIQKKHYGGYRANLVTYSIALISYKSEKRINLNKIWKEQSLSEALVDTILDVSQIVYNHITCSAEGKNVTEWCKKRTMLEWTLVN